MAPRPERRLMIKSDAINIDIYEFFVNLFFAENRAERRFAAINILSDSEPNSFAYFSILIKQILTNANLNRFFASS